MSTRCRLLPFEATGKSTTTVVGHSAAWFAVMIAIIGAVGAADRATLVVDALHVVNLD